MEHAWEWTNEHGGIILKQLRRLGASCDWDRTAFTMDEKRSKSVVKVFVDLYNKGQGEIGYYPEEYLEIIRLYMGKVNNR